MRFCASSIQFILFHLFTAPLAHDDDKTQHVFENNCASRKLCNRPFEERHASVHAIPPEWQEHEIPKSHWKPVGHPEFMGTWAGHIPVLDSIDIPTFWTKYFPNKPFVLSGFAKSSPAFERWTDAYLVERIGNSKVRVIAKNEDRLKPHCNRFRGWKKVLCRGDTISFPDLYMNASLFFAESTEALVGHKIVTQMPDILRDDILAPSFHSCARRDSSDAATDNNRTQTMELSEIDFSLSLDMGEEFSTSVIHYEASHQVVCLLDGRQEWIVWDMSRDHERIPMWASHYDSSYHRASSGDDSPIDAERVDLFVFPGMAKAEWRNVTLHAGDCLFMPALFAHYTRSWERTVAVSHYFSRDEKFDTTCAGDSPQPPQPLSSYEVLWTYPEDRSSVDWDMVKMRFPNWKQHARALATRARRRDEQLKKKEFIAYLKTVAHEAGGINNLKTRAARVFSAMDLQAVGFVSSLQIFRSRELQVLLKDIAVVHAAKLLKDTAGVHAGKAQQYLQDKHTLHSVAIAPKTSLNRLEEL